MDNLSVLVGEWRFDGVKLSLTLPGARVDIYPNGKIALLYDLTYHVNHNNGVGPRENTASLCGVFEATPRPALGTRPLDGHSAPTELNLDTQS